MLDYEAPLYDEGSLARRWEERIRVQPDVFEPRRARRSRRLRPIAGTVYWLGLLWFAALIATFAAVHGMQMSYQVDGLQTQYTGLVRQEEGLKAEVAALSSPATLERDARRLKVTMHAPKTVPLVVSRRGQRAPAPGYVAIVTRAFRSLRQALTGR